MASTAEVADAIRTLAIRGAPAIGVGGRVRVVVKMVSEGSDRNMARYGHRHCECCLSWSGGCRLGGEYGVTGWWCGGR